ncbi:hypothetical protein TWF106_009603 [Orbilia oligospora]|uniref:Uncharacterized protein n=1 Tax=Orbilia oligospora TaxID=2813651 RepID=A0A6G1MI35_ORBOL|nr:hypothetical protein TWF788_001290 [Orbilia oligospora]KAF3205191.1 hypothetical protein TWF679_009414 [Orbilia oligospora]KAF3213027.1 hypothetical protein TWF106_009603 [Orbilia oligospora]KAF3223234.1 hypothetical protein TWF191_006515 [Orbilia oligospora]KAF3259626.1 hypothetical protein TWF192_010483 [Orbilia oligospora]
MDFLKKYTDSGSSREDERRPEGSTESGERTEGNFFDKASNFVNEQAGGGKKGEQKEDTLDKAIDYVQENVFKQGPQDNESAAEQAKDGAIADFIRDQYKKNTGKEFPVSERQ